VQLDDVFYASSHGLEIKGPLSYPVQRQMADLFRPDLEAAMVALEALKLQFPGVELEDNSFAVSVHYRNVRIVRLCCTPRVYKNFVQCASEFVQQIYEIVREYADSFPRLVVKEGRKVFELRPRVSIELGCTSSNN
jgi:trehalose-phosphatase